MHAGEGMNILLLVRVVWLLLLLLLLLTGNREIESLHRLEQGLALEPGHIPTLTIHRNEGDGDAVMVGNSMKQRTGEETKEKQIRKAK